MSNETLDDSVKEVFYEANQNALAGNASVVFLYPPKDLYNNNDEVLESYTSRPNDVIETIDIGFLRLNTFVDPEQDAAYPDGDWRKSNVAGAFYAVEANDYFYKANAIDSDLTRPTTQRWPLEAKIGESIKLPIDSIGGTFENKSLGMFTANVNRFDDLEVDGLNEGDKPTTMQTLACRLEGAQIEDITYRMFTGSVAASDLVDGLPRISADLDNETVIYTQVTRGGIAPAFFVEWKNDYVHTFTGEGYDTTDYVSAVEIANVTRELDDTRYGSPEDDYPYIFTGAGHVFTDAELSDVETKTPLAIDIDVWGGDCYVGLHTFKINDTSYSLTDQEKLIDGTGVSGNEESQTGRWEYYFDKSAQRTDMEDVSRPFPVKGASQTITVLLESEINPEVAEKPPHAKWDYTSGSAISNANIPVPQTDAAGQIRSNFKYRYNLDFSHNNEYKVLFPYKSYEKKEDLFGGRLVFSDQKIYNSDIEGFDRFRALNFYDMDESNGSVQNLVEAADRIYAVQESAFSYVPVTAQIIETADGANLSVRSGEVIGIPVKINTLYGTQDPRTVMHDSSSVFFVDKRRGEVCMYDGQQVKLISRIDMESYFSNSLPDADLSAWYDNKKKEYAVYSRKVDSTVFNLVATVWSARYPEATATSTLGGLRIGETMMVIGIGSDKNLNAATLYESGGAIGEWWGTSFDPSVTFFVNPEPDVVKTFDAFNFHATRTPIPQSFEVTLDDGTLNTAVLTSETPTYQEGTWRMKSIRAVTATNPSGRIGGSYNAQSRIKGTYGVMYTKFGTPTTAPAITVQSGMTSVLTKYRSSFRPI